MVFSFQVASFRHSVEKHPIESYANGNHITLPPGACAGEIEAFRIGLIMELIELEIEMTAKDAVLRLVRNFRRRA